jgi:hypothetical protein
MQANEIKFENQLTLELEFIAQQTKHVIVNCSYHEVQTSHSHVKNSALAQQTRFL